MSSKLRIHRALVAFTLTHGLALVFGVSLTSISFAVPSPLWSEATWFFKSPSSPFPSGQTSRQELEKFIKNRQLEASYSLEWDQRTFKARQDQVLRDIHLSSLARVDDSVGSSANLYSQALANEQQKVTQIKSGTLVRIMPSDPGSQIPTGWVQVYEGQWIGWMRLSDLKPLNEDTGYFRALMDTYLRSEPKSGAAIVTTAPRDSVWAAQRIVHDFIEVQYLGQKLYLDLNHLAHRSDFADWAYHKKKGWLRVLARSGAEVITQENKKFPLEDFSSYKTDPMKGIMKESLSQGPKIRSRVHIQSMNYHQWFQSRIEGHGDVWWKQSFKEERKEEFPETLMLTDLLKRDVFSISFDGQDKTRGLISSHGIYRTENGTIWEKIHFFNDDDYPVLIHSEKVWFVGSYRSTNFGKSFEPFIRWDKLTDQIQQVLHRPPLYLRLVKIEALKYSQVQITFETGYKRIKLRGHILGHEWNLSPETKATNLASSR